MGIKHIYYSLACKIFKLVLLSITILFSSSYSIFGGTIRGTSGKNLKRNGFQLISRNLYNINWIYFSKPTPSSFVSDSC